MISKLLFPVLNLFKFHKKKILAFVSFFILFVIWMFPLNDLGDFVAIKVSELSGGQVFVNFENLELSFFPQPGLAMTHVTVETPFTPALTAKTLAIAPSISGLLSFKPGVTVRAGDLLGGDISLSTRGGDKNPAGKLKQKISLDVDQINLSEAASLFQSPMKISGHLSGNVYTQFDPELSEQPTGEINLNVSKLVLPEGTVFTPMGPIPLPKMNLNDLVLEGKAEKGSLEISKFVVGAPGGDLYANVSGRMDVRIERQGFGMEPRFGAYDLNIKLQVNETTKQKLGTYLGILQSYQTAANSYSLRVYGTSIYAPPNITKAQ